MSCRLGVVALGDSITNGGGELQYGVALQSWALWTARGLGLPYTGVAVDGARAADVVARQLPAVEAQAGGRMGPRLPLRRRQRRARARLRRRAPSPATTPPRWRSCPSAASGC